MVVVVLAALVTATPAGTLAASATPRTDLGLTTGDRARLPVAITYRAPAQYPEGVAWDPTRRAFLVSSARYGTVSIVHPDGTVQPLVTDHGLVTTLGVKVDATRGRLLVAFASNAAPSNTVSGLGIFDLATGRPIHLVNLKLGTGPQAANDLALDPQGNAYVTDTFGDVIYRVNPRGQVTGKITDPRFASDGFGVNGIVWHPRGFLLTARYDTGQLFRVSPSGGGVDEVTLDRSLPGADGLALRPDGQLIVVTNNLGGHSADAARILRQSHNWRRARHVSVTAWPDPVPTTVALTPSGAYVVSSRLDRLLAGDLSVEKFTLRRIR